MFKKKENGALKFSTAKSTKVCVIKQPDAQPGKVMTLDKVNKPPDQAWWKPDKDEAMNFAKMSLDPALGLAWAAWRKRLDSFGLSIYDIDDIV